MMARRSRAQVDLDRLEASGETQLSLTDPDARLLVKGGQGVAGYNVQAVVDDKHKLIVASEVVNDSSDVNQLHAMAKAAKEALDVEALQVLADEGYYSSTELKACEDDGITAYVPPSEGNGLLEKAGRFGLKNFSYDGAADAYTCPAGQLLRPMKGRWTNTSGRVEIRYASPHEDLPGVPVKNQVSHPEGISTHHPSLGARGCPRTSPRADGKRKRPDAPSFRHRRTSLRHAQMPHRLSPLPRSRLRQGARRMEPDGALLQLYPRAQYPRLQGLRGLHGKAIPSALTRSLGRFKPLPARSGDLLDKYPALAPDQTLRPKPCRVTLYLLSLVRQHNRLGGGGP